MFCGTKGHGPCIIVYATEGQSPSSVLQKDIHVVLPIKSCITINLKKKTKNVLENCW